MRFEIIWPEKRYVSDNQIRLWYGDAIVNGETTTNYSNVEDMAMELHYIGHITLGKGKIYD